MPLPPHTTKSHFEGSLSRALTQTAKDLLVAPDLAHRVRRLKPLEFYHIVKELGVESAKPIIFAASRSQLQTIIDFDCWDAARPSYEDLDVWLAPFAQLGPEYLSRAFLAMDDELQTLWLAECLQITELEDEDSPIPQTFQQRAHWVTPDRAFVLEAKYDDDEREITPISLAQALYKTHPNETFKLLKSVAWELSSPLEESAYRFRLNRLEELGFPERTRALRLFATPPKTPSRKAPTGPIPVNTLPTLYASPFEDESLLAAGLRHIDDNTLVDTAQGELIYLVNTALVAYDENPGNLDKTRNIARRVHDTVCLGIETIICSDEYIEPPFDSASALSAARAIENWTLYDLFRHGYQTLHELKLSATRLSVDPVISQWLGQAESTESDYGEERLERAFLKALLLVQPLLAGYNSLRPDQCKAFSSKHEVQQATQRLNAITERLL